MKMLIRHGLFLCLFFPALTAHAFVAWLVTVEDIDPDVHRYDYLLINKCFGFCTDTIDGVPIVGGFVIRDFYVPYFADAEISLIGAPDGWTYEIDSTLDLFDLGAGVLHWTALEGYGLGLDQSLSGFTYYSSYDTSVKAPFEVRGDESVYRGDPPIPASPQAIAAGLPIVARTVPVPGILWLFAVGIGIMGWCLGRVNPGDDA